MYIEYIIVVRDPSTRGAARRDVGQRQHMSWRTTASRPEPATEGREDAEDGDMAEQAARDLHWQQRLHAERLANGISAEDEANYIGRPEGPAAGVAAELRRIDPSGRRQVSADVEQRCAEQGWELEHLGVTIGTVVHGPRLSEAMSSAQISTLNAVLLERKVIFFRGQQGLSEREHIAFAERFGSTEVFPFSVREGAAPQVMPLKSVGPIAGTCRTPSLDHRPDRALGFPFVRNSCKKYRNNPWFLSGSLPALTLSRACWAHCGAGGASSWHSDGETERAVTHMNCVAVYTRLLADLCCVYAMQSRGASHLHSDPYSTASQLPRSVAPQVSLTATRAGRAFRPSSATICAASTASTTLIASGTASCRQGCLRLPLRR